jgi:hypothetical protein
MTPQEQDKQRRIESVRAEKYAGRNVVIEEVDNWRGLMSSQIYAMKRRGNLPPQYSYKIAETQ